MADAPNKVSDQIEVSVVIPCHTELRWNQLVRAIESARHQVPAPVSIIVSVDGNRELFARLNDVCADGVRVVLNSDQRGASSTRNTGAQLATSPIVAFLDDDASARPGWLAELTEPFADQDVVGTGGLVVPRWCGRKPDWFPAEFGWVVGASFRGLPTSVQAVRNVWSENMAVRKSSFDLSGGFRPDFTKVGDVSRPDDTDLCIRMGKLHAGAKWMYTPEAIVDHDVLPERGTFVFYLRRCYSEGRGKIELARENAGRSDLSDEQSYIWRTLPTGLVRYMWRAVRSGSFSDLKCAGALVAGIAAATVGAIGALIRHAGLWRHWQSPD